LKNDQELSSIAAHNDGGRTIVADPENIGWSLTQRRALPGAAGIVTAAALLPAIFANAATSSCRAGKHRHNYLIYRSLVYSIR
jgi:hypothetical protein